MQVSVESNEGLERRMTVELPAEKVGKAMEKRLKEIARTARLDGFRPGKVPMSVVRKRFGGQVQQEVFGDLVQSSYFEALANEQLKPAGKPAIEPMDKAPEEGMGYVAVFEVMPEIELAAFSSIVINRPAAQVTDDDVNAMVEKLRKQRTTWNEVNREAREGDQANIDFKGFIDGEAFDGGTAEGVPLVLGSGSMIPGFEDGLIGAKGGDERTLKVTFPEDYRVDTLAGKEASFEVKVHSVSEPVLPEIDEEFAKAYGVAEGGVDALYQEIRANMERELADKIRSELKEQAMDALLEVNSIDVPKALVSQEAQALQQQTKDNMAQGGQTSSLDLPLDLFEEQAKRRVMLGLLISEVVKANAINIDQERVREKVDQFAQSYEAPQEVIDYYYSDPKNLAPVENVVLEDQVVDWVLEQATVEDVESGFEQIMSPPEAPDS